MSSVRISTVKCVRNVDIPDGLPLGVVPINILWPSEETGLVGYILKTGRERETEGSNYKLDWLLWEGKQ